GGAHADRPRGQEPVGQRLELGPTGPGQACAEDHQDLRRVKVDAVAVSPSGPASRSNSRLTTALDTGWFWPRSGVRPVTSRTRVSGSTPRSAASARQRPYR